MWIFDDYDLLEDITVHGGDLFVGIHGQAEKNELCDEKQRLKTEKQNLEPQVKALGSESEFLAHPAAIPTPYSTPGQVVGGYPGVSMWHFLLPAAVDTSQDHILRPPVA
ncbi:hypothetical protein PTKIN_Ptkin01aG0130700 [Pterospermum kingtungense]